MNTQLNLPDLDMQELAKCIEDALNNRRDSFNGLEGSQVLFDPNETLTPLNGWNNLCNANIKDIDASDKASQIAAVDSSAIFIADTPNGSIYAAKSGIAIAYNKKSIMHFKIGPTLLYINESYQNINKLALLDHSIVKRMIRIKVERALQNKLAESLSNTIILVDGSLKVSLFEDNINHLTKIVDNCNANENILVGISKVSRLKLVERLISSLNNHNKPCYLNISHILRSYISNLIGEQLLIRLSKNGLVLRADIINNIEQVLSLLLSNDSLHNGYPETLRLAHHLSVFTKTEVLATIGIISSRFNLNEIDGCDARKVLLGKIGVR
ncbi:MAG: hypothetical protein KatS3mg003_2129 [Candidatus Nitrosocaldaceae archaeon]|nr:MAG: hypothetical protein KatS3mg003_2129 [Candidatus Nitrosocaldaceae archaeon]